MDKNWTENELLIAMNVYWQLPFEQFRDTNPLVQQVAEKLGRTPGALSMKLANFVSLDPVYQSRGVTGLKSVSKLDKKIWNQFNGNWSLMTNKSEFFFHELMKSNKNLTKNKQLEQLTYPDGPSEEVSQGKVRRTQRFFRKAVVNNYGGSCAITGINMPQLLIASHIIPWSESKDELRAKPSNGICLNALHDKAFDKGLITIDENYQIVLSDSIKQCDQTKFNFMKYEGKKINLPYRSHPKQEFLEYHRNNVYLGSRIIS